MTGAGIGAGIVAGKLVTNNIPIPQLQTSPLLSGGLQLVVSALLIRRAKSGSFVSNLGGGMAANGVVDLFKGLAGPDVAAQIGLTGLGQGPVPFQLAAGSNVMPGVAGMKTRNVTLNY